MKRRLTGPEHEANGANGRVTATTTEPFAQNRYRKYRFQHESILLNAPETSGVYGLYSAFWIYLGEADNIRVRLLEHLTGDDACINHHQPSGFAFELISSPDRSRKLQEMFAELQPLCGPKAALHRTRP